MRYTAFLLLFMFVVAASAQIPVFDAASIRSNQSIGEVSAIRFSPGRTSMVNVSLKKVMLNAYGIQDDREYMIDGPDWLTSEHFDIEAKFPADTAVEQVRKMLQAMLADRFKLALHRETRQLPMYALVVAKSGPKIHPVEAGQPRTSAKPGHLEATKITMQKLADLMAKQSGRPVADETSLPGVFDFTLDWSPEADLRVGAADSGVSDAAGGASIFTAIQEQLGLRLESRKGPVEVLVVDRMEKVPSAN